MKLCHLTNHSQAFPIQANRSNLTSQFHEIHLKAEMKQLDGVVSPPAFLWDPYLTLINVIFDLDICGL